ncbi:MAG TPA: FecR domain-containing protein [Caulobacteraceae bacterium]|jgi:transmembrane sensor|nr:FecR domain-containing protein [Caulobacteraceae bacterium]
MQRQTAHEIDAAAAAWAARVDRGPLSPADQEKFEAWLDGDVRCLGAYGRVRGLALNTERARALGPPFEPSKFMPPVRHTRRAMILAGGAAAAGVAGVGALGWVEFRGTEHYMSRKGEVKVVALRDGSVVTLNTASRIAVDFSKEKRSIALLEGEALFDVAKDRDRPFVVTAGTTQVRAVGTSFTVRHLASSPVQILVREGVVEITQRREAGPKPVLASANTEAVSFADRPLVTASPLAAPELQRQLAWRDGRIEFDDETLDKAAAAFARYSDIRIVIDDPSLGREEISGLFQSDDPVGFAQAAATSLNARAQIGDGEVRLTR